MTILSRYIGLTSLVVVSIFLFTMSSEKTQERTTCLENEKFYEPMLIPTKEDTLIWEKIKHRFSSANMNGQFYPMLMPYTRGQGLDSSLITNDWFDKFPYYNRDFKVFIAMSPLVIKGKVLDRYFEDTINPRIIHFKTNYIIEIEHIYYSKYTGVKLGDNVMAKTHAYGVARSTKDNKLYSSDAIGYSPYEIGKSYLFVLDKYWGMMVLYNLTVYQPSLKENLRSIEPTDDVYCPYSFYLGYDHHLITEKYENKIITDEMINYYFNKK